MSIDRSQFRWSMRVIFLGMTLCAASVALSVQVPHVALMLFVLVIAICTTRWAWRWSRRSRIWRAGTSGIIAAAAWMLFYCLSIGPFIVLSEWEYALTGRHRLGRWSQCYRPVMVMYHHSPFDHVLRWYTKRWIPSDAVGLHVGHVGDHAESAQPATPSLVGTWQSDQGTPFEFRPNNTGNYLSKSGQFKYFEWSQRANTLSIYVYFEKRSASAWFGRQVMNYSPTEQYTIVAMGPSQFKIKDAFGTTTFERAQDGEMDAVTAP